MQWLAIIDRPVFFSVGELRWMQNLIDSSRKHVAELNVGPLRLSLVKVWFKDCVCWEVQVTVNSWQAAE